MKKNCRLCGEKFTIPQETVDLLEEGYINPSDIDDVCDDCMNDQPIDYTDFSDADPGL